MVLAELGSLSVEFTRLAQITKEAKYYDAVARITIEFEKWQNHTKMPGLWPQKVDASGCKKEEVSSISPIEHSLQKGAGISQSLPQGGQLSGQSPDISASSSADDGAITADKSNHQVKNGTHNDEDGISQEPSTKTEFTKRQLSDDELTVASPSPKPDCIPQGLASPPYSSVETFTLGGQADSVYEYLPKEYMLLGGLESQYQSMYEMSVETTKKYLLFRPMIPEEKRDILFAGQVSTQGHLEDDDDVKLKAEGTHLTCFVGGMFAIGAKIFDRKGDLDLAKKLTDGCVWAYESTTTGIMPEHFLALPCASREKCPWNETAYWEALDPYGSTRVSSPSPQAVLEEKDTNVQGMKAVDGGLGPNAQQDPQEDVLSVDRGAVSEEDTVESLGKTIVKRQLTDTEDESIDEATELTTNTQPKSGVLAGAESDEDDKDSPNLADSDLSAESKKNIEAAADGATEDVDSATATKPVVPEYTPPPIPTLEEYAKGRIRDERLPLGIVRVTGSKYILR